MRIAPLALLIAVSLRAQNPPGAAAIDNKLDTPQVRVYVATLSPHTPVPSRTGHATDRVLIYLDNGVMTRQDGSDKAQKIEFHRGEVRWRPASGALCRGKHRRSSRFEFWRSTLRASPRVRRQYRN